MFHELLTLKMKKGKKKTVKIITWTVLKKDECMKAFLSKYLDINIDELIKNEQEKGYKTTNMDKHMENSQNRKEKQVLLILFSCYHFQLMTRV